MAVFAHITEVGTLVSFFDTEIGVPPPFDEMGAALVEVSPEVRDAWIADPWQKLVDGVLVLSTPPHVTIIPQSISRFQARAALLAAGMLADVEAVVAAADLFAQLAWAEAQEWRRDSPTLLALAHGIGLTDADIDDLFIQASKIVA